MMIPTVLSDCSRSVVNRRALLVATTGGIAGSTIASLVLPGVASVAAATATATPEEILAAALADGMPGAVLAIEHKGDVIFSGAAGVASIETETPLKTTDRFRIYSITKTFTATIVLQLVEEGTVSLDDTVAMWLDDPDVGRIPHIEQATIRQVLNHSSGIYDFGDDDDSPFWDDAFLGPDADWSRVWTIPELLAYADGANHDPYFAPGEGVHYSNTNYLLLGMIVEKATANDFSDELRTRILTPLGLDDTALAVGGSMPGEVVDGYQLLDGDLVNVSEINLSWVWTAGGIVSTAADLLRFAAATQSGELLSPESLAELFTFAPSTYPSIALGSGLYQSDSPNGTLVGMDGGSAGFEAIMMWLPEEEITVVVLTNRAPDDGATEAVRDEAFAWALSQ